MPIGAALAWDDVDCEVNDISGGVVRPDGEDFLVGLDRQRADAAGQRITPVPGLASTTAAGLARRLTPAQWQTPGHSLLPEILARLRALPALP